MLATFFLSAQAATATGGFGVATPCGSPAIRNATAGAPVYADSTVISSTNGELNVTLSVVMRTINFGAFSMNTRTYCVGSVCSVPGPTLSFSPGDLVNVVVVNGLGSQTNQAGKAINSLRFPNSTNLHTHGARPSLA